MFANVTGNFAAVVPVTRIDSPSAMITNSAQRSAMCALSTFQSAVVERPSPGTAKPTTGARYSTPSAITHHATRSAPPANPPASQNTADSASQHMMRRKLRKLRSSCPRSATSMNSVRASCMKT